MKRISFLLIAGLLLASCGNASDSEESTLKVREHSDVMVTPDSIFPSDPCDAIPDALLQSVYDKPVATKRVTNASHGGMHACEVAFVGEPKSLNFQFSWIDEGSLNDAISAAGDFNDALEALSSREMVMEQGTDRDGAWLLERASFDSDYDYMLIVMPGTEFEVPRGPAGAQKHYLMLTAGGVFADTDIAWRKLKPIGEALITAMKQ
ncbi:hypothetical protein K1X12_14605 [Hyphomonas sp. WL0036]|uniref:hypothetical protein n=1 Tax=Hyphomonas sediminis TaxID=2866160 RepID=UPI001C7EB094|nr:hypothetical protein [Hyphomonas sediminis]MBY9068139.1 hypothetical protein [Hyphomonas sediminis]